MVKKCLCFCQAGTQVPEYHLNAWLILLPKPAVLADPIHFISNRKRSPSPWTIPSEMGCVDKKEAGSLVMRTPVFHR